ncbi:MAG TPA: ORF6C domain-containing protein [Bryobacteraceae bacterium]|nr:ORF6C domain-containing protein [Bryobacteraceae bacterium]
MNTEAIIATLLSAAAFLKKPVQDATAQTVKEIFDTARYYMRKKFGEGSDGAKVLDLATEKPESVMRKGMLVEETAAAGLNTDSELMRLVEDLARLMPAAEEGRQAVTVNGDGNRVQVAGRDFVVHASKHVHRSVITPDERHVTTEQRDRLREVIGEVATRLAVGGAGPNYAAVHRMLQRRFNVASYALIEREQYDEALKFLKQHRAIFRSRLRRRDPVAYDRDFYRAIFSLAGELAWDRSAVYRFAEQKLGVKRTLTSLKQLGPNQLQALADLMRREAKKNKPVAA